MEKIKINLINLPDFYMNYCPKHIERFSPREKPKKSFGKLFNKTLVAFLAVNILYSGLYQKNNARSEDDRYKYPKLITQNEAEQVDNLYKEYHKVGIKCDNEKKYFWEIDLKNKLPLEPILTEECQRMEKIEETLDLYFKLRPEIANLKDVEFGTLKNNWKTTKDVYHQADLKYKPYLRTEFYKKYIKK